GNSDGTFSPQRIADRQAVASVASKFLKVVETNRDQNPAPNNPGIPTPSQPTKPTPAPATNNSSNTGGSSGGGGSSSSSSRDYTAPTVTLISTSPIVIGNNVIVTSNETGIVYLVPTTENPSNKEQLENLVSGGRAKKASVTSIQTNTSITTEGLLAGSYKTYAMDASGNVSVPTSVIELRIAPVNHDPVVSNPIPPLTSVIKDGAKIVSLANVFSDSDGDVLTYNVVSSNSSVATVGINGTDLTVTPVTAGTSTITVTASDGKGGTKTTSFTVTFTASNHDPNVKNGISSVTAVVTDGPQTVGLADAFEDQDGDTLTYIAESSSDSVAKVEVSGTNLTIKPVSAGEASIKVTANDNKGGTISQTFTITVVPDGVYGAVNATTIVSDTRKAIDESATLLNLTSYKLLSFFQRDQVAQAVLDSKGTGYKSRLEIQDVIDRAVNEIKNGGNERDAVQAVNEATTNEEMWAALRSPKLHLDNSNYKDLEGYELEIVAKYLIDNRGTGYATRDAIQQEFDHIIDMILQDWGDIVADVGALKLEYASGDSRNSVTQNLVLPTVGAKRGASIVWTSSNPDIISNQGVVSRPSGDTKVKLTALLTNRYEHYSVTFTITVKAAE
ncbi:hypothetical protein DFP93_111124, partial [Aneurinibacillus soli]